MLRFENHSLKGQWLVTVPKGSKEGIKANQNRVGLVHIIMGEILREDHAKI